jgi:hypothetical protein
MGGKAALSWRPLPTAPTPQRWRALASHHPAVALPQGKREPAREGWGIIRSMSGAGATEKPLGPTRRATAACRLSFAESSDFSFSVRPATE